VSNGPNHVTLRGIAWDHPRGFDPLVATASAYAAAHAGIAIAWEKRSLQAFADAPVAELAEAFDLIVIDHPHMGEASKAKSLMPLDTLGRNEDIAVLAAEAIDGTHASYHFDGHQWALAIDAAAQVAAYRPNAIARIPETWVEVARLAAAGRVVWPLKPVDALMSFFTLAANQGTQCAASPDRVIERDAGRAVLRAMTAVSRSVPKSCLMMNPIDALELLSSDSRYWYCPLLYGYSNYARKDFRPSVVRFANIPAFGELGDRGSTLGGAGLAVSSRCQAVDVAVDYVFWVASAKCQSGAYFTAGGQPAALAAWEDDAVNAASNNFFRDTRSTLEQSWIRPRYAGYPAFQERGGAIVNAYLDGRLEETAALESLDAAYRESQVNRAE
jgi:multiple sugar transport system substrate-binding protein